jgi:hypothetical protein
VGRCGLGPRGESTTRLEPLSGATPPAAARRDTPGLRWRSGCSGDEAASVPCLPTGDRSVCREPLPRQPLSRWRSASSCETLASTRMWPRSCMPAEQRRSRRVGEAWTGAVAGQLRSDACERLPLEATAVCCVPFTLPLTPARPGVGHRTAARHAGRTQCCAHSPSAPSHPAPAVAAPSPVEPRARVALAMAYQPPLQQGTDTVVVTGLPQPQQQPHVRKTWRGGLFDCFGAPHALPPPPVSPKAANTRDTSPHRLRLPHPFSPPTTPLLTHTPYPSQVTAPQVTLVPVVWCSGCRS